MSKGKKRDTHPDKPELKIEDCKLKIYGFASLCLFNSN